MGLKYHLSPVTLSLVPIGRYVYPKGELRDQMQSTMMSAWASFARDGSPDTRKRSCHGRNLTA